MPRRRNTPHGPTWAMDIWWQPRPLLLVCFRTLAYITASDTCFFRRSGIGVIHRSRSVRPWGRDMAWRFLLVRLRGGRYHEPWRTCRVETTYVWRLTTTRVWFFWCEAVMCPAFQRAEVYPCRSSDLYIGLRQQWRNFRAGMLKDVTVNMAAATTLMLWSPRSSGLSTCRLGLP